MATKKQKLEPKALEEAKAQTKVKEEAKATEMLFFWKPPCVFTQWHKCSFAVDGQTYTSAEQYMMAEKARLFHDFTTLKLILESKSLQEIKRLGREVSNFDETVWQANRMDIVVRGNMAKFSQNLALKQALVNTGTRLLVEASPFDRIWGIGLPAEDPRAKNQTTWRGKNLLGVALMKVRADLCM